MYFFFFSFRFEKKNFTKDLRRSEIPTGYGKACFFLFLLIYDHFFLISIFNRVKKFNFFYLLTRTIDNLNDCR